MSPFRGFAGAVVVGYAGTILGVLASLFLTRQAFGTLGAEALGRWFMLLQAMAFLPVLDLGAQSLCAREVATARGAGQPGQDLQAALARRGQMLRLWPLLALASLVAWWWAAARTADPELRRAIGLVLLVNAAVYPLRHPGAVLQGLKDQVFLGAIGVVATLVGTGLGVGLLWAGAGFAALAAGWAAQQLVVALLATARVAARHGWSWLVGRSAAPGRDWSFWSRGLLVTGSALIHGSLHGTDALFAGVALGAGAAASLGATGRLVGLVAMLGMTMGQVGFPRLAEAHGRDPAAGCWQEALRLSLLAALVTGALGTVATLATPTFLRLWLGLRGVELHAGAACAAAIGVHLVCRQALVPIAFGLTAAARDRSALVLSAAEAGSFLLLGPLALRWTGALAVLPGLQAGLALVFLWAYLSGLRPPGSRWTEAASLPPLILIGSGGAGAGAYLSAWLEGPRLTWLLLAGPGLIALQLLGSWIVLRLSAAGRGVLAGSRGG